MKVSLDKRDGSDAMPGSQGRQVRRMIGGRGGQGRDRQGRLIEAGWLAEMGAVSHSIAVKTAAKVETSGDGRATGMNLGDRESLVASCLGAEDRRCVRRSVSGSCRRGELCANALSG